MHLSKPTEKQHQSNPYANSRLRATMMCQVCSSIVTNGDVDVGEAAHRKEHNSSLYFPLKLALNLQLL